MSLDTQDFIVPQRVEYANRGREPDWNYKKQTVIMKRFCSDFSSVQEFILLFNFIR